MNIGPKSIWKSSKKELHTDKNNSNMTQNLWKINWAKESRAKPKQTGPVSIEITKSTSLISTINISHWNEKLRQSDTTKFWFRSKIDITFLSFQEKWILTNIEKSHQFYQVKKSRKKKRKDDFWKKQTNPHQRNINFLQIYQMTISHQKQTHKISDVVSNKTKKMS